MKIRDRAKKENNPQIDIIKGVINAVGYLKLERDDFQKTIKSKPDKVWGKLGADYYWSRIYTYSFIEHIQMFFGFQGIRDELSILAGSSDPQEAVMQALDTLASTGDHDNQRPPPTDIEFKQLFCLQSGLIKSYDCIMYFGVPLDILVRRVANGDDSSLFNAVRIDRSITACPPVADRIARAESEDDERFFKSLSAALKGKPKKPKDEYNLLRFVLYLLSEMDSLDSLSMEERYQLICVELGLYPIEGEDPARSLQTFVQRWRKTQ